MPKFGEYELNILRQSVGCGLSQKRLCHIFEVEKMAVRLGRLYLAEKDISGLRAAALLHDITKEYSVDEHLALLKRYGETALPEELESTKTLHARTAALIIPDKYPEFADRDVIDSVRYHTTGRAGMSIFEKLIFLADYIDESRTFSDCVRLREMFWGADPMSMNAGAREEHLNTILLSAIENTFGELIASRCPIHPATVAAWNSLTSKRRVE